MGIGTEPEARRRTLGDKLRGGTSNRSEKPIEAAFARDEFDSPRPIRGNQFVVSFGDAKNFIEGLDPLSGNPLFSMHGNEHLAKGGGEPLSLKKQSFRGLGIGLRQSEELPAALRRDNARGLEEENELVPGKIRMRWSRVDEVQAEPATQQVDRRGRRGHADCLQ